MALGMASLHMPDFCALNHAAFLSKVGAHVFWREVNFPGVPGLPGSDTGSQP